MYSSFDVHNTCCRLRADRLASINAPPHLCAYLLPQVVKILHLSGQGGEGGREETEGEREREGEDRRGCGQVFIT